MSTSPSRPPKTSAAFSPSTPTAARFNRPEFADLTSIPQHASVLKLQFQRYWKKPSQNEAHLKWMRVFYTDLYSGPAHKGTSYHNQQYEGCYINYPMPICSRIHSGLSSITETRDSIRSSRGVKCKYDPNNIFHRSMSVRA